MSTAVAQKTPVEAKWNPSKLHEETANLIARQFLAFMQTLAKYGPEAHQEFLKNKVQGMVEYFKTLGIKTPIDLVRAMAEFESNIFGSKIQIVGDDKKAELTYDTCGCWNAMQKIGKLTPQQEERMGQQHELTIAKLAEAFGFKGTVKYDGEKALVTFTK